MKPIQTFYKGYYFHLRLEARWAIFLDALNAKWSYEAEGFDLDGIWYLPDFWVHDWNVWIEIKGKPASEEENRKCKLLARASGKSVLLLVGEPWSQNDKNEYDVTLYESENFDRSGTKGWEFGEGRRCSKEIWLVSDEYGARTMRSVPHERDDGYPLSGSYAGTIIAALASARSARFEHGE